MRGLAVTIAIAALALASPAHAQAQANIVGEWVFEAPLEPDDGCVITGRAVISPPNAQGEYAITTTGEETCPSAHWRSVQSCVGRRTGAELLIDCTIVSAEPASYIDDDFTLRIASRDLMQGRLLSSRGGDAIWRRTRPPLVS
ncbi:MAG: hypothetical protein AB7O98_06230 [Hyphomonadaceae bacterium]